MRPAPDLLDWVINDAPEFGEAIASVAALPTAAPTLPRPTARPALSRRSWFILWGSLVSLSLIVALCPGLGQWVIRAQLAQTIEQEDNARLSADSAQLQQLTDPAWWKKQQGLIAPGEISLRPLPMLVPVREAGQLRAWVWAASNVARAEVARKFVAPDGSIYTFLVPQYYRYTDSVWKRVAPPDEREPRRTLTGHYAEMVYAESDAALIAHELAPALETALARACATWVCPEGFRISIIFGATPRTFFPAAPLPDDPLLFAQAPIVFNRSPRNTLALPAPNTLGRPLEEPGLELFKRAVIAQALLVAADGLLFREGERDLARNAFLYALVARLGAQLNIETSAVYAIFTSPLTRTPTVLWDIGVGGTSRTGDEMRRALAMVNWILHERPSEAELALFDALRVASDPVHWLVLGLGLPAAEAQQLWAQAETATFDVDMGYRVLTPPSLDYALALGCQTGPAVVMGDDAIFRPLPDYGVAASAIAIAPGRQRVALSLASQPAILDFTTQRVYALPNATPGNLLRLAWLDEARVAYVMYPSFWSHEFTLNFFDVTAPRQPARILLNLMDYALAPNSLRAAVVSAEAVTALGPALQGPLGLMPAEGGPITLLDSGAAPAWSPDGQWLAYLHGKSVPGEINRQQFELRLADPNTGLTQTVFAFTALGPRDPTPFSALAWSPDEKQVAFTASVGDELYLLLVTLDGEYQKFALGPNLYHATQLSFVMAGNYIALTRFGERDVASTLLYQITSTPAEFPPFDGVAYWAPASPAWLWAESNRVSRMDSLLLNNARPLLNAECDVAWAP